MPGADSSFVDPNVLKTVMASFAQILTALLLLSWCFIILSPFLTIIIWGVIISVALYPTHLSLSARLGGREKLSATILILIGIAVIVVPTLLLAESTISGLREIAVELEDGTARVPPPADSVADWPIVGEKVHQAWSAAANNLEATVNEFKPQLKSVGQKALSFAGHAAGSVFQLIFSVIIAGVLFMAASSSYKASRSFLSSLLGAEHGPSFADLTILTIRSVAKGVLGIAIIQSFLSAIGLLVADVPAAGIWAGVVLVLAIVQLPPLIVLGPIAIWYFSVAEPMAAWIFLIYATIVSVSDTFLKPLLLGRGVETPMLVILIGAIGGAIAKGFIGLFIGAVILALSYELLIAWMGPDKVQTKAADS